jgi:hypothetical protein
MQLTTVNAKKQGPKKVPRGVRGLMGVMGEWFKPIY